MLFSLPKSVRNKIYALALPFSRVELEVTDEVNLLTRHCILLQISKEVREDVLDACSEDLLELVYTFRSPTTLINANTIGASQTFKNLRIVLLAWIEDNNIPLTPDPEYRRSLEAISGVSQGWRTAFRTLPEDLPLKMVYFDFANEFGADVHKPAKLLNMISAVVQRRSQRQARCRIIGCKTAHGQRFLEKHTVGVILDRPDWMPRALMENLEAAAGPSKEERGRYYTNEKGETWAVESPGYYVEDVKSPVVERSRL